MAACEDTIFLTIAKEIILKDLERIKTNSIVKDNSFWGSWLRKPDLSQEKQTEIENTIKKIKAIKTENYKTDMAAFAQLNLELSTCFRLTSAKAASQGNSQSSTEKSIGKTIIYLTLFYNIFRLDVKMEEHIEGKKTFVLSEEERDGIFVLLDKKNNNDPINVMIYFLMQYAAYYCYRNRETPSFFKAMFEAAKAALSSDNKSTKLADDKVNEVLNVINELFSGIDLMDKENEKYAVGCCNRVIEKLEYLQSKNKELCHDASTGAQIPLFVNFSFIKAGTHYQPSPGVLQEYVQHALQSCEKIKSSTEEECSHTMAP